ncbi:MAG TPA: acyl-CoA reductase, partial [Sphingobacteriaceae bacterium]|nr:acyl-CoA reductase [Sphingobacteriaceae bacterium]
SEIQQLIEIAGRRNPWFTPENVSRSLRAWSRLLQADSLSKWLAPYPFDEDFDRHVGLVFAGNIPLVGFHDLLAVLLAGYKAKIKLSSQDQVLNQFLLEKLIEIEPEFSSRIHLVERLQDFDLVIATGSDNTARYFDYYFGKYPHIIRKNRNSVAILDGTESQGQLHALGEDIFSYYGLGCRNVSKLFVPKGYDVAHFYEGIAGFESIREHYKYVNNYDFNKSIYLINGEAHFDNGFLLLKPAEALASPLAVLYFQEYDSRDELNDLVEHSIRGIQCIVGNGNKLELDTKALSVVDFGQSQYPDLDDYADGVNTLEFLAKHKV